MATLAARDSLHRRLLTWRGARKENRQWSSLLWSAMGVGACIALLNMLILLTCVDHCLQESRFSASAGAWFFCDLLLQSSPNQQPESPSPYHHHTAPRGAFEPILVQVGLISATVFLVGRLSPSARPLALGLPSAPPTPPPRTA